MNLEYLHRVYLKLYYVRGLAAVQGLLIKVEDETRTRESKHLEGAELASF